MTTHDDGLSRNYWPLAVSVSLGMWWVILAIALDTRIASTLVTGVACVMATMVALADLSLLFNVEQ